MSAAVRLRIGEMVRMTGLSVGILRHYEAKGLLRPQRDVHGDRLYDTPDVVCLEVIRALSLAGMPLVAIGAFLLADGSAVATGAVEQSALVEQVRVLEVRRAAITAALDILQGFL